jgi:DNA-binding transcriptional LysR family regulator
MELRHLRYFVAVAEELHFSRAAARLNIATPTLSAQIQALEAMLGAQLFTRKTRSVTLTQVGRQFLDEARATLQQADHAELVGRQAARGDLGSVAVGYVLSASCGGLVAPPIVQFKKSHPNVTFHLRKMETIAQMKALVEGALDVGFTREPERYPTGLTGFLIDRQSFYLAVPEGHRLASSCEDIAPDELVGEPFVGMTLDMEMGFWSNLRAVTPPGTTMQIAARMPDALSVVTAVAAGIGLGVLSGSLARIGVPGVVYRRITQTNRYSDHAVVYRKNEGAPVIRSFVAQLRARARTNPEQASAQVVAIQAKRDAR